MPVNTSLTPLEILTVKKEGLSYSAALCGAPWKNFDDSAGASVRAYVDGKPVKSYVKE